MVQEMRKRRAEEGFTLVELLIVIVVLGLLAGIVTLGVTQFTTDAKEGTCKASRDNLQIAVDAYETKNGLGSATGGNAGPDYAGVGKYTKAGTWVTADWTISGGSTTTASVVKATTGGTCAVIA